MSEASPIVSSLFDQDETRILYVDDDPILREFASVNLSGEQASVALAADGIEALEQLRGVLPDIMVLDLEMPQMDGFEVLARLRDDPAWAGLPVIVATGREDVVAIDRAFELGATAFVVKPGMNTSASISRGDRSLASSSDTRPIRIALLWCLRLAATRKTPAIAPIAHGQTDGARCSQ